VIPNIFHFVFLMAEDFGGRHFSLSHYLAIKSAVELNKQDSVYFHYDYEPSGEWWEKTKPLLLLKKIKAPGSFMGRPLFHVNHKADVVRLLALKETGGIYLDLDTISVKPLTGLLSNSFVIGQEFNAPYIPKNLRQRIKFNFRKKLGLIKKAFSRPAGLCNAVLLSEKNSDFVNRWLAAYSSFRSKGRDKYWSEHSGKVPTRLAAIYPESLTKLGPYSFHYPLYDKAGLRSMFEEVTEFPEAYLHHLWESFSWNNYLSKLTIDEIADHDTTYNLIARKFL
jgi:hypothetical protein